MTRATRQASNGEDRVTAAIWPSLMVAFLVTILDGFDAFSLSLVAPHIAADLSIDKARLGLVFGSSMGGMIIGAIAVGLIIRRLGKVRSLMLFMWLFGAMALMVPLIDSIAWLIVNRMLAGLGMGAAAPIAIGMLNRPGREAPSDMAIAFVWSGLPFGGVLAAAFNYLIVSEHGWHSIFVAGGVLPIAGSLLVAAVCRSRDAGPAQSDRTSQAGSVPNFGELFSVRARTTTASICAMFFFGYVTTSMLVYWLPTIMTSEQASDALVSKTFAALNIGSAIGQYLFGAISVKTASRWIMPVAWLLTGGLALLCATPGMTTGVLAIIAVLAATVAAGAQCLAVALANRAQRASGLEVAMVGLATGSGRMGQFVSLTFSGLLLSAGLSQRGLLGFAGVCACIATLIAVTLTRSASSPQPAAAAGQAKA